MKIKVSENSVQPEELKAKLEEHFAGKYTISNRGPKMLVVAQTKIIGTTILIRKNSLIVNGNFSTMGAQMIFVVVLLLLGILIPFIIYFAVFHRKMKELEKEVAAFVKDQYVDELI